MPTALELKAARNDALRKSIPFAAPPNKLVLTRGVASLPKQVVAEILQKVRDFDSFDQDCDPYLERDFGSFDHQGLTIFWKIDNYNGHDGLELVMTILLAEEY